MPKQPTALMAMVRRVARETGRDHLSILAVTASRLDAHIAASSEDADELARLVAARAEVDAEIDRRLKGIRWPDR